MNFEAIEIKRPSGIPQGTPLGNASNELPEQWLQLNSDLVVRNVSVAKLISFPAATEFELKNESIIIAPGGGMMVMAMEHEGVNLAEKFSALGYDAYVLQYRLNPTPRDNETFKEHCSTFYSKLLKDDFGNASADLNVRDAVKDLKQAISTIKSHYTEAHAAIHFLGFSAGAYIGREYISEHPIDHDLSSLGMIYGDLTTMNIHSPRLPHLFGVMASDDPLFSRKGLGIIRTWHEHRLDPELHFFRNGGHGFGDRINGKTSDAWLNLYTQWLKNIAAVNNEEAHALEKTS
jgi:dienelactone hydrolase